MDSSVTPLVKFLKYWSMQEGWLLFVNELPMQLIDDIPHFMRIPFTRLKLLVLFYPNDFMKKYLAMIGVVALAGCDKQKHILPPPAQHPAMEYTALNNVTVKFGQHKEVDIDGNNSTDLLFSTVLVGDPIGRVDKRQYFINGFFDAFSLVNEQEQTPVLNNGDAITIKKQTGFNWYNASSIMIAEKIIGETGPARWEGNWKNADHKYFALQVRRGTLRFNGWVELSFKTATGEFVLHRAAISKEAGKDIIAGK
jgi:hypothetical protein